MTILSSQLERAALGINSFERAIIYSALLLRIACNKSADTVIKDYFQIKLGNNFIQDKNTNLYNCEGTVTIKGTIKYDNSAIQAGGNIGPFIIPLTTDNIQYTGSAMPPSNNIIATIKPDPSWVTTLEQYFFWCCCEYHKILLGFNDTATEMRKVAFSTAFQGTISEYLLNINVLLFYNYIDWLESGNLLGSDSFNTIPITQNSLVGNNTLIGNNFLFGN